MDQIDRQAIEDAWQALQWHARNPCDDPAGVRLKLDQKAALGLSRLLNDGQVAAPGAQPAPSEPEAQADIDWHEADLLPCPKCGSADIHRRLWMRSDSSFMAKIVCRGCGLETEDDFECSMESIVTDWNDRPRKGAPEAQGEVPAARNAELSVWYGPMPESNGKSNFTAVLHRGDLASGHTIARSEYPDRVRYYADCVRWLIGELKDRPDILAYNEDLHSGYVDHTDAARWRSLHWHWEDERDFAPGGRWWCSILCRDNPGNAGVAADAAIAAAQGGKA